MKKIMIFLLTILLSVTLWAYSNDWRVDISLLDNNETSYTLNYVPNHGKPLLFNLAKIDKEFSIRVMLPSNDNQIQEELREYYKGKMSKELKKALKSSCNLHNPTLAPLIKGFPLAFKGTSLYKSLEKTLNQKGYWIDKEIIFEKFTISKNIKPYLFYADIWLQTTPFREPMSSAKIEFPNRSEEELIQMLQNGLWNYEKSAVVVYPSEVDESSIYIFFKNKLDKFMGLDISRVEKMNLGKIGLNLHFDKVETKAIEWMEHERCYRVKVETKAWLKGKRYRRSEELLIDKSAKVLWR